MQIMNTFVAKIGPAGKRNRAARRRAERRQGFHTSVMGSTETLVQFNKQVATELKNRFEVEPVPAVLDFSVPWDETIARKALEAFAQSGQSQRAFAAEHSFPESRLRSWKKKLEG